MNPFNISECDLLILPTRRSINSPHQQLKRATLESPSPPIRNRRPVNHREDLVPCLVAFLEQRHLMRSLSWQLAYPPSVPQPCTQWPDSSGVGTESGAKGCGGTMFLTGNHKGAYSPPKSTEDRTCDLWEDYECSAGSALIFSEAVTHTGAVGEMRK